MKKIIVKPGEIFGIPLFMPKDDWEFKFKLTSEDLNKDFVFGRVIQTTSDVLVEIFNKVGNAHTELSDIISSGVMFSPLLIFWDAIVKNRWIRLGQTEDYDKYKDSNFANLKMVFGPPGDFRLKEFSTGKETPISREEMERNHYSYSVVWDHIRLENKIIEKLATENSMPNNAEHCRTLSDNSERTIASQTQISDKGMETRNIFEHEYVQIYTNECGNIVLYFANENEKPFAVGEKLSAINEAAYMNGYNWDAFFYYYLAEKAPDILESIDSDPEAGSYVAYLDDTAENEEKAKRFAKIIISLIENDDEICRIVREKGDEIEWD